MGHEAKWEYFQVIYERYRKAKREARHNMLNEFCLTTGYNRKYAIRLLNGPAPQRQPAKRARGRSSATASRRFPFWRRYGKLPAIPGRCG